LTHVLPITPSLYCKENVSFFLTAEGLGFEPRLWVPGEVSLSYGTLYF